MSEHSRHSVIARTGSAPSVSEKKDFFEHIASHVSVDPDE